MNPDAQRIAIAEACGWTRLPSPHGPGVLGRWTNPSNSYTQNFVAFYDKDGFGSHGGMFPDYLNDLNAMASAVSSCVERTGFPFQEAYTRELRAVVTRRRRDLNEMQVDFWMAEATAAQRAEAFLKCLGKWKENHETT